MIFIFNFLWNVREIITFFIFIYLINPNNLTFNRSCFNHYNVNDTNYTYIRFVNGNELYLNCSNISCNSLTCNTDKFNISNYENMTCFLNNDYFYIYSFVCFFISLFIIKIE
jgi:hypothetical protein